jgi:mannosylglycerate hydrolase
MPSSPSYDVYVVAHTHWDREWYHPAGRFRQRLVAMVDELLADDALTPEAPFLLDGQCTVLVDYLAERPEHREKLAELLRSRALEAGPWYVLADELIPSGESLVRNLLAGARTLREFGAHAPPVLYSPDAFGHPAVLPAIAQGFALSVCILWRGLGGLSWPDGDLFHWRSRDGTNLLVHHLPPDGYEFGSGIPLERDRLAHWWSGKRAILASRARSAVLLLTAGADHHAPPRALDQRLAALSEVARPDRVHRSSLRQFAATLCATEPNAPPAVITGELRDSAGHCWSLRGTLGVRSMLKRRHALVERLLLRDAEPWVALSQAAGREPPAPLVHASWRRVLECQPHDTLCGCAADEVARAMHVRLEDAKTQGRGLREDALLQLLGHDREAARERAARWTPVLVVRNRAARPRRGVACVELLRFVRDVPVGPGSASAPSRSGGEWEPRVEGLGAVQELGRSVRHDRTESPRHYPDDDLVESVRVAAWVDTVPGYTVRCFPVVESQESIPTAALPDGVAPASAGAHWIGNGRVGVEVRDGIMRVGRLAPDSGCVTLHFEDVGDAGDLYTHSAVGEPLRFEQCSDAQVTEHGPLRATLSVRYRLTVPSASQRSGRSTRQVTLPIELRASVHAGEEFARLDLSGKNRARDHRLRLVLRTPLSGDDVHADAAFGTVRRSRSAPPATPNEIPPATSPLHRHVTLARDAESVTLLSDGLTEYEATPDGALCLTLLRAVGELSRDDLPERAGHAGWPLSTPDAQQQGRFGARFGILLATSPPAAREMIVEHAAEDFLLPLVGGTLRSALARYPDAGGITLEGDGLAFSCCKPADVGDAIVLRCVNLHGDARSGRWRFDFPVAAAALARLDETPLEPLGLDGGSVPFRAPPFGIITVIISPKRSAS